MQTLHAGTLVLEPLCAAHADDMYPLLADPALYEHLDHPPPPSVEHLRGVYRRLEARRSPDGRQQWLNWVLREVPPGRLLGYVQATVEPDASAWIAYVLGRPGWGRGHATVATRCMMQHLAEACGVRRWRASVEQANRRSIALLERLGFVEADAAEAARHGLSASERLYVAAAPAGG